MTAKVERIAYAEMITPSTSECGSSIISGTSLQVPGSPSSALTTRYLGMAAGPVGVSPGFGCGMKLHFMPVGTLVARARLRRSRGGRPAAGAARGAAAPVLGTGVRVGLGGAGLLRRGVGG